MAFVAVTPPESYAAHHRSRRREGRSLRLLEHVELRAGERALVTILGEEAEPVETALLSQPALAADWDREEEDEAWQHLQP